MGGMRATNGSICKCSNEKSSHGKATKTKAPAIGRSSMLLRRCLKVVKLASFRVGGLAGFVLWP